MPALTASAYANGKKTLLDQGTDDAVVSVTEAKAGTGKPISSGEFKVQFNGVASVAIKFDETAMSVANSIATLVSEVNKVRVSRDGPDLNNGYVWSVTFMDSAVASHNLAVPAATVAGINIANGALSLEGSGATAAVARSVLVALTFGHLI